MYSIHTYKHIVVLSVFGSLFVSAEKTVAQSTVPVPQQEVINVYQGKIIKNFQTMLSAAEQKEYSKFTIRKAGVDAQEQAKDKWLSQLLAGGGSSFGGSSTMKTFIDLGARIKNLRIRLHSSIDSTTLGDNSKTYKITKHYLDLTFLSRAALGLDSVIKNTINYLSSLDATPLTIRTSIPIPFLSSNSSSIPGVDEGEPISNTNIKLDFRSVPYTTSIGTTDMGGAANAALSYSFRSGYEGVDPQTGEINETGFIYIEPTAFVNYAFSSGVRENIFQGVNKDHALFGAELRVGLEPHTLSSDPFNIVLSYLFNPEVNGGGFKIKFSITPHIKT